MVRAPLSHRPRLAGHLLVVLAFVARAAALPACTPEGVTAQAGETQVSLTWNHPEPVTYKILRSEFATYGFSVLGTTTQMCYVDKNLPSRTFYYVVVAAEGTPLIDYRSATVSATPTDGPPPAPAPLTLRFSINLWTLEWDMPSLPPDLAGFNLYQRRNPGEPWARLNNVLLPVTTRRFIGNPPKSKIYLRLGSVDRAGHETLSLEKSITPGDFHAHHPNDKDPIPTGLTATGGETIVDLAWDPIPGSFGVYRSTTSGSGYVQIGTTSNVSYRDAGLPAGTYYYVVTSIDGEPPIESPYSTEASATVTDDPPPAPYALVLGYTPDSFGLNWSLASNPPDLLGVRIWKSYVSGGPYVPAAPDLLPHDGTFWAARPRARIYLKASTVDAAGHESMSAEEASVDPADLVREEPKLHAVRLGASESVSATGGELILRASDLAIPVEAGFGFSFERVYRSGSDHDTTLGRGWSHRYEQTLTADGADFLRFDGARGRTDRYAWDAGAQSFLSPPGFYDTLASQPDGTYTITDRDGKVSTFTLLDGAYRLTQERDRGAHTLTLTYAAGRLVSVLDSLGRAVTFSYGADGRLASLADFYDAQNPRTVGFVYSPAGDLFQVTDPLGHTRKYGYAQDQPHPWLDHNLLSCLDGQDEAYLVMTYDEDTDRVVTQQYGTGSQVYRFAYAPVVQAGWIRMTDRRGEGLTRVQVDSGGHAVQRSLEGPGLALTWTSTYNADGEPITRVEPAGNAETWTYDAANPNPLKRCDLLEHRWIGVGMPADEVETFTYLQGSPWSLVKTHTSHGVLTTYFYDVEEASAGDLNGDGRTDQAAGNVVKLKRPTVTQGVPAPQVLEEKFWQDDQGRRIRAIAPNGAVTRYEYFTTGPQAGYLQRVTEAYGQLDLATTWTVDAVGNATSRTSPGQHVLTFTVDRGNHTTQVDGPLGYQVQQTYDENGRLTERRIKNVNGEGLQDPDLPWLITTTAYTVLGDVASETRTITGTQSVTKTFTYDADQNPLSVTHPGGRQDTFVHDPRNLLTRSTQGAGTSQPIVREYAYEGHGQLETMSWASGVAMFVYDGFGRRKRELWPGSLYRKFTYGEGGCCCGGPADEPPIAEESGTFSSCSGADAPANGSEEKRDEAGRLYETNRLHKDSAGQPVGGGNARTRYERDANGDVVKTVSPNGAVTVIARDAAGRVTGIRTTPSGGPGGDGVEAVLDAEGNPTQLTWSAVNTATSQTETRREERQYDDYGRATTIIEDPGAGGANLTSHFKHDSQGNVVEAEDPLGNRIRRTYDGRGNVRTQVHQPAVGAAITLSFDYDADGRLTGVTDGLGHATTYTRNALGQVSEILYPNQASVSYVYDGNGWPTRRTDPTGTAVDTVYMGLGAPVSRAITRGPGVEGATLETLTLDAVLRPVNVSGETGYTTFDYTTLDEVEKAHRFVNELTAIADTTFAFNEAGDRTRMTYPNGRVLDFTVDPQDRLREVREGGSLFAAYEYAGEEPARRSGPDGLTLEIARDALFRVTSWRHLEGATTVRAGFAYAHDAAGRKKHALRIHDGLADVYRHDGLHQLTGVKAGVPQADLAPEKEYGDYLTFTSQRAYELDEAGNRKSVTTDGVLSAYNYVSGFYVPDLMNQIQTIDDTTRVHDANGNVTDDGTNTYSYNWRNQVVRAWRKSDGKLLAHYTYDALGRRERRYVLDAAGVEIGWVDFLHDGDRVLAERDQTGAYLATFVLGNGSDEVLSVDRGGQRYVFHEDELGSVCLITDGSGVNVEKVEYGEYGAPTVFTWDAQAQAWAPAPGNASQIGNTRMFTGREWDAALGLYDYRARTYDPRTGRFVSPDPLGLDADDLANDYRYVGNDPTLWTDPTGLERVGEEPTEDAGSTDLLRMSQAAGAAGRSRSGRPCVPHRDTIGRPKGPRRVTIGRPMGPRLPHRDTIGRPKGPRRVTIGRPMGPRLLEQGLGRELPPLRRGQGAENAVPETLPPGSPVAPASSPDPEPTPRVAVRDPDRD
ncbi:MAG: hypothetical protein HYZ53_12365 [Planctomycetes bacterium]|nr:hypothetical protein [Planctomycetota bacterium]